MTETYIYIDTDARLSIPSLMFPFLFYRFSYSRVYFLLLCSSPELHSLSFISFSSFSSPIFFSDVTKREQYHRQPTNSLLNPLNCFKKLYDSRFPPLHDRKHLTYTKCTFDS
eukprot:TRINITY_DN1528_c0_g1_i6.p1 TRINITY_DN1528_c0_g1~~TRINITY_DN1528_c0_g1_i6.p1  ORF type:complete len:112 (-),score=4.12 TRINITY_DN1528_c0_g1_i6:200-535(-)